MDSIEGLINKSNYKYLNKRLKLTNFLINIVDYDDINELQHENK